MDYKNKGLLLLKKGQKGIVHAVFSRFGLILLMFLVQGLRNSCPICSAGRCCLLLLW